MAQAETEQLTCMGAALSRALSTIAEPGSPQSVESLASATGTPERSLYRIMRFLASHGLFQEIDNRKSLLEQAGFQLNPITSTSSIVSVIEGIPQLITRQN